MNFKYALPIVAFLGLTACTAGVQADSVAALEAAYAVDAQVADDYVTGKLALTPDATVAGLIGTYDGKVYNDIVTLRAAAQNGTTITAAEQVAAQEALEAFETVMTEKGILNTATKLQAAKEVGLKADMKVVKK